MGIEGNKELVRLWILEGWNELLAIKSQLEAG